MMAKTYRDLTFNMSETASAAHRRASASHEPLRAAEECVRPEQLGEWPSFPRETFGRLYRPSDVERAPMKSEPWAVKATQVLEAQAQFPELLAATRQHRDIAASAAASLSAAVAGQLGLNRLNGDANAGQDPAQAERRVRRLAKLAASMNNAGHEQAGAGIEEDAQKAGKAWGLAVGRRRAIEDQTSKLDDAVLADIVRAVASQATKQAEAYEAIGGFCGMQQGLDRQDPVMPIDIVEAVMKNPWLLEVLRMLGRMKDASRSAALTTTTQGRLDVVGITVGGDVSKLVSGELARLGTPGLRMDTMRRLVDKSTLVREQRGEKREDRGEFVVLLDKSGSMEGQRTITARAIALSLILGAIKSKRRCFLVMFDSTVKSTTEIDPMFSNTRAAALSAAFEAASARPSGGTNAVAAMQAAVTMLQRKGSKGKKIDTAIVTDGEWDSPDVKTLNELTKDGGQFHEIRIGNNGPAKAWTSSTTFVPDGDVEGASKAVRTVTSFK